MVMVLLLMAVASAASGETVPRCLVIYSYHQGYPWNDAVDRGVTEALGGACELRRFYMDSKRNPDPAFIERQARRADQLVTQWEPDAIIAVDDNASRFLVVPYLKEREIPVVFCGVNWSADEYGFPFRNMTGMVEVSPIDPLFSQVFRVLNPRGDKRLHVHVIDADRFSAHKEYNQFRQRFGSQQVLFHPHFVETFEQWKKAFVEAQQGDLVLLTNNAGIDGWEDDVARAFVQQHTRRLVVSTNDWMTQWSALVMAKEPEEQGEWAAEAVRSILAGTDPASIPVTTNRRWQSYLNPLLLNLSGVRLPDLISRRSVMVSD